MLMAGTYVFDTLQNIFGGCLEYATVSKYHLVEAQGSLSPSWLKLADSTAEFLTLLRAILVQVLCH